MTATLIASTGGTTATPAGTSAQVTIPASTAGSLLALVIHIQSTSAVATSVTDDVGGTWAKAIDLSTTGSYTGIWYRNNVPAGITTVTATESSGVSFSAVVQEWSGIDTTTPVRATNFTTVTASPNVSGTVTATSGDVVIGAISANSSTARTLSSADWTAIADATLPANFTAKQAYKISTGGSEQATWTTGSASNTGGVVAAFAAASGAPASVSGADTGSFTDSESVTVSPTGITTSEAHRLPMALPGNMTASTSPNGGGDTLTATEVEATAVVLSDADTATFVEGQSVANQVVDTDGAAFIEVESQAMEVFQSDPVTATEGFLVGTPIEAAENWTVTEGQFIDATVAADDDRGVFSEDEDARETYRWLEGEDDQSVFTERALVIRYNPVFRPPLLEEGGHFGGSHRLFSRYRLAAGVTVAIKGSTVTELMYPAQEDLLAYDRVYRGGYAYRVTTDEIDLLAAAGYGDHITLERTVERTDDPGS